MADSTQCDGGGDEFGCDRVIGDGGDGDSVAAAWR